MKNRGKNKELIPKICIECNKEFIASRKDKKFCTDKCRAVHSQKRRYGIKQDDIDLLTKFNPDRPLDYHSNVINPIITDYDFINPNKSTFFGLNKQGMDAKHWTVLARLKMGEVMEMVSVAKKSGIKNLKQAIIEGDYYEMCLFDNEFVDD